MHDIPSILDAVSRDRIRRDLFYLSSDPLPFRRMNYTRPGADVPSLYEADAFIESELKRAGVRVSKTWHRVQAFRCDPNKPIHHWYAPPAPDDPWYDTANIEATIPGTEFPDRIIQLVSHKDSMSWIDSPGAHDNACGTVANLEIVRVLAQACPLRHTVRVLFCNEEHTPWTSRFAARAAAERGDDIVAVLNQDALDGKSDEDMAAGRLTHVVGYSTEEGRPLADLIARCNERYRIGLDCRIVFKERVNDDDGEFIKAGFRTTVMNVGSFPYADSEYHLPGDRPERVDIGNLTAETRLVLAAVLELDGQPPADPAGAGRTRNL